MVPSDGGIPIDRYSPATQAAAASTWRSFGRSPEAALAHRRVLTFRLELRWRRPDALTMTVCPVIWDPPNLAGLLHVEIVCHYVPVSDVQYRTAIPMWGFDTVVISLENY